MLWFLLFNNIGNGSTTDVAGKLFVFLFNIIFTKIFFQAWFWGYLGILVAAYIVFDSFGVIRSKEYQHAHY